MAFGRVRSPSGPSTLATPEPTTSAQSGRLGDPTLPATAKEGSVQKDAKIAMIQIGNPRPLLPLKILSVFREPVPSLKDDFYCFERKHFFAAQPVKKRTPLFE